MFMNEYINTTPPIEAQIDISNDLLSLLETVEAALFAPYVEFAAYSDSDVMSTQNIIGVGIGLSDSESIGFTASSPNETKLILFTENVIPEEELQSRLAGIVSTQALSNIQIQQVTVGRVDAYSHSTLHNPAPGGVSVGHFNVTAGTLGSRAIGLTPPWDDRHLILSNNHVLANVNDARDNDSIIQPSKQDNKGKPSNEIAVLARWIPILFGDDDNKINYVDAAFGWVKNAANIRGEQYSILDDKAYYYKTGTVPLEAIPGMIVGKSGRTTGLTRGRVTAVRVSIKVNYGDRVAQFRNQISIESVNDKSFSKPGDSGSLIWSSEDTGMQPVGLLFAGGKGITYANPIRQVLTALDIRLLP